MQGTNGDPSGGHRFRSAREARDWLRRLDNSATVTVLRSLQQPGALAALSTVQLRVLLHHVEQLIGYHEEMRAMLRRMIPVGPYNRVEQFFNDRVTLAVDQYQGAIERVQQALRYADMPWGMRRQRLI